ncbi:zinc finger HIT domain-containing protein 3 [Callorhinchus milii]|uniref:zinc finger HIT domain-containing protein 3 n=1 Tax=Callorhinchus milii TaxID=7868 RepID=UPI001C3FA6B2|nr:zinc finger HIT domain-containing protein 3 [Callorhinchus milii]
MSSCCVCDQRPPRYRCPRCRERYCSVGCYKRHQDDCKPQESKTISTASEVSPALRVSPQHSTGHSCSAHNVQDENEESDWVAQNKLSLLADSEELKSLLCNPHLRDLLLTVDQARDKGSLMKTVMQEPIFVEFADQCLQIVEPRIKKTEFLHCN